MSSGALATQITIGRNALVGTAKAKNRRNATCEAPGHFPEVPMKASLFLTKGVPLERQKFTWRDLVQKPPSAHWTTMRLRGCASS
jgi:hypothetical protein